MGYCHFTNTIKLAICKLMNNIMNQIKSTRIVSLDLLKGIIIVMMIMDHSRIFFYSGSYLFDPADPEKTNLLLFLTRWITHFCAPAFSVLAGISAYLIGLRKSKKELSIFLLKRGIWLIFVELIIVNFGWTFDIYFSSFTFGVIWCLGISMIVLSAIIHLKMNHILIISLLILFGHNLLDTVSIKDNFLWSLLHEKRNYNISNIHYSIYYPIIPWIGIMSIGYYFGSFYNKAFSAKRRRKIFNLIGIFSLLLFVAFRSINQYGNYHKWETYDTLIQTIYSFVEPAKYPPSLTFLLLSFGIMCLILSNIENTKGKVLKFFSAFGRVPFFVYIIHIFIMHFLSVVFYRLTLMYRRYEISNSDYPNSEISLERGTDIGIMFLIWIGILIILYPICKKFGTYKQNNKDKWWLSYF